MLWSEAGLRNTQVNSSAPCAAVQHLRCLLLFRTTTLLFITIQHNSSAVYYYSAQSLATFEHSTNVIASGGGAGDKCLR